MNPSAQTVLDCIKELSAMCGAARKADILTRSGLTPHVVKEWLDKLVEDGMVKRLERGVYVPVKSFPAPRPISRTILPDGMAIIEVGDTVIHLTPVEEAQLGKMYAGNAVVHATTQAPAPVAKKQPVELVTLDDIADMCGVSRRYARDFLTKRGDFPSRLPSTSRQRPLWSAQSIREYWSHESRTAA